VIPATGTVGAAESIERSVVPAGDYLNKLSGEQIEYHCRRLLEAGCKELIVDFSKTDLVNSVGISILLGVIDVAASHGATVAFSDVKQETIDLFSMLGLTRHVNII
jgi:anti-anti-sigma regulatory factor